MALFQKKNPTAPAPAAPRRHSMSASPKLTKAIEAAKSAKATTLRKAREQAQKRGHTVRIGAVGAAYGYATGAGWLDRLPTGGLPKPVVLAGVGFGLSVMSSGELGKIGDAAVDTGVAVATYTYAADTARERRNAAPAQPARGVGALPPAIPSSVVDQLDSLEHDEPAVILL